MAKFDYREYENFQSNDNKIKSKVGYFNSLKDDGDTAIVRFAYQSPNEFDIVTVHKIQIDGNWRSVSCLRGPYDPIENCPLCQANYKLNRKIYIKMLEYTKDENGNIVPHAVVWERPAAGKNDFVKKLMSIIGAGYTNLSQYVFTIKRNGKKGSLDTSYEINPAHPEIYPNSLYVADFSDFEGFDLSHHSYIERTYDDIKAYVTTGVMPQYKKEQTNEGVAPTQPVQPVPSYQQPQQTYYQPQQSSGQYVNPNVATVVSTTTPTGVNPPVQPTPQVQSVPTPVQQPQQPAYTNPAEGVRPRRTTYNFS